MVHNFDGNAQMYLLSTNMEIAVTPLLLTPLVRNQITPRTQELELQVEMLRSENSALQVRCARKGPGVKRTSTIK